LTSIQRESENSKAPIDRDVPLVVDLDGTLIRSDLLVESFFQSIGADWRAPLALVRPFLAGKASFKYAIAGTTDIDPALLPYNDDVLVRVRAAVADGRPVYLASASTGRYVAAVADYLGIFTGWFASDAHHNLSAGNKARCLVEAFGQHGFDYIGNDRADLTIWAVARRSIAVGASNGVRRRLNAIAVDADHIPVENTSLRTWLRTLRVHQYVKNALVFVPLVTSHSFDGESIARSLGAFASFSLCASSVYIVNDLVDLTSDRGHPTKRTRPLADGRIAPIKAILVAVACLVAAVVLATFVSTMFTVVLSVYFASTSAYSFSLKRKMLVDVIMLAILYTIRVIGGAAAVGVMMSEWLLAFSLFIFVSLALIKRYTELSVRLDGALPDPTNRNYRVSDLPIVAALAAAAGFNAITVFTMYISSETVRQLYRQPLWLWLVCPILIYWIGRVLMLAHRRMMDDDPVVFALKDWRSRICAGAVILILVLAIGVP
jgi:4-hydroxybenzoate polyprenyltransferase